MVKLSILKGVMPTKIFQQYQIDRAKIPFANAVLYVPQHEIRSIMQRAHATGELTPQMLEKTLVLMIKRRAFERAQVVLRCWQEELNLHLSPIHTQMALNLAVQTNHWREALGWWKAIASEGTSTVLPEVYTSVLKALRQGGAWEGALTLLGEIDRERIPRTAAIQHGLLLTVRNNGPWDVALRLASLLCAELFETKTQRVRAIQCSPVDSLADELNFGKIGMETARGLSPEEPSGGTGSETSPHVFTEVLHILHVALMRSSKARLTNPSPPGSRHSPVDMLWHRAWRLALRIYRSPPAEHRTTALQNACVEVLARSHRWQHALELLAVNLVRNESDSSVHHHRVLTPETLSVLLPCLRSDTARLSGVLEVATRHSVPIPSSFFESLFRSVLAARNEENRSLPSDKATELIELFMRLRRIALNSTTECIGYHALCRGMCDALVRAPDPNPAFRVGCHLKAMLESTIPLITENISGIGSEHTIHVVEGRIAVVDGSMASLLTKKRLGVFFDTIFLPFSVTRDHTKFFEKTNQRASVRFFSRAANEFLQAVRKSDLGRRLVCLSFLAQLKANMHLSVGRSQENVLLAGKQRHLPDNARKRDHEGDRQLRIAPKALEGENESQITQKEPNALAVVTSAVSSIRQWAENDAGRNKSIKGSAARTFAIALMLKQLNFDAEIYIVTQSEENYRLFADLHGLYGKLLNRSRMPIPMRAVSRREMEQFFQQNPGRFKFRVGEEAKRMNAKEAASCRVMKQETLALNI